MKIGTLLVRDKRTENLFIIPLFLDFFHFSVSFKHITLVSRIITGM